MALDKAIEHGKERRKPYYKSKAVDATCRPGGSCPYCQRGRQHKHRKRLAAATEQMNDDPIAGREGTGQTTGHKPPPENI